MLKILFQYLTDSYALLENPVDNYIIMGVVGGIAFLVAYSIVGWFYDEDLISGSSAGSILHWIIRFIVFVVIYYVIATIIRLYKWVVGLPNYVWWIALTVVIAIVVGVFIIKAISHGKKKGVFMKDKVHYVADNTVLNYPELEYKFNRNTYVKAKKLFWAISLVVAVGAGLIVFLSENEPIKVIASALMGGAFSLIVWLMTIEHQDNMNYEIAKIDAGIMLIDNYIERIEGEFLFFDPINYKIIKSDNRDTYTQFLRQCQLLQGLLHDEKIDTSEMKVVYMNKKECTLDEFLDLFETDAHNHFENIVMEECKDIIEYNYFLINRDLVALRKKLCRYKTYIYCGSFKVS